MKTLILFSSLWLTVSSLQAQAPVIHSRDTITDRITLQLNAWPQEKIYLHTDRDYYIPGEKIWFKAYVADAATHQPTTASRYVYVDLVNEAGLTPYQTILRCTDDGMYHGNMFLSDAIPEGDYTLRAYTRYMANPDEDYFFRKLVRIGSITPDKDGDKKEAEKKKEAARKSTDKKNNDYAVSFFPEGGNLPAGSFCRVAFKAVGKDGYGLQVSGTITDETGKTVATATTGYAGMGNFTFIPEAGKRYTFQCTNADQVARKFDLPVARSEASSLSANLRNGRFTVTRIQPANPTTPTRQYLLIHCRGQVLHFAAWEQATPYYAFPTGQLPTGVIQCLLLDESLNPLSERLVFNRGTDRATLAISTNKDTYKIREKVTTNIVVMDENDIPLTGSFSVSVTDDRDIQPDSTNTILTSLLLTSELKGYIESPGYYFESEDPERLLALDNLLMTQGWRRYDIPAISKGEISSPVQVFETGMPVTGIVKSGFLSKPVVNGDVMLMSMANGSTLTTKTGTDGRFVFDEFEYMDTLSVSIQARNEKDGDNVFLTMDNKEVQPGKPLLRKELFKPFVLTVPDQAMSADPFVEKAKERSKYDEEMRVVYLREVEVVAKRPKEAPVYSQYTNVANAVVDGDRIERLKRLGTEQFFRSLPGVIITPDRKVKLLRYIQYTTPPLILIDGVRVNNPSSAGMMATIPVVDKLGGTSIPIVSSNPLEKEVLDMLNPQDIKAVEIFVGVETAVLGSQAFAGAINIITYTGGEKLNKEKKYNLAHLTLHGYQPPVEFYSPVYETEEQRFNILPDLRTTIFWKPDLVTDGDGKASFDFYASDYSTTYSVVIEGLSDDGVAVRQTGKIQVK